MRKSTLAPFIHYQLGNCPSNRILVGHTQDETFFACKQTHDFAFLRIPGGKLGENRLDVAFLRSGEKRANVLTSANVRRKIPLFGHALNCVVRVLPPL
jgi:hypothetical protein